MTEIPFTKVRLPYGWLGNMSPHAIKLDAVTWPTAEHLFQASRFDDEKIRETIRTQASPMQAKLAAKASAALMVRQPRSPEDVAAMAALLAMKIRQHPALCSLLVATGDARIIEDCSRRPSESGLFWGAARADSAWTGRNTLGVLWMDLRRQVADQAPHQGTLRL